MPEANRDALMEEAKALPADEVSTPSLPIPIILTEAGAVAKFVDLYWDPAADGSRPGLVVVSANLPRTIAAEIRTSMGICSDLHVKVLFPGQDNAKRRALVERANKVVPPLAAAVEYTLDDGVEEPIDEAWRAARQRDVDDGTQAGLAQTLADYAGVAEPIKDRLAKLADFDPKLIDEARQISTALMNEGPPTTGRAASADIDMRNRHLTLLARRVAAVRLGARYVFRDHPDIIRLVTSAYERRRRVASKNAKKPAPTPTPTPAPTPA